MTICNRCQDYIPDFSQETCRNDDCPHRPPSPDYFDDENPAFKHIWAHADGTQDRALGINRIDETLKTNADDGSLIDVVSDVTRTHESESYGRVKTSPPGGMIPWRRIVANRVSFNHDDRNRFAGKAGAEGNGASKIRAELWHAVY